MVDASLRPWETLSHLSQAGDTERLEAFMATLQPGDIVRAIFRLSADEQGRLLTTLSPENAAELIEDIPEAHAIELIDHLAPEEAGAIIDQLPSDEQADLLAELDEEDADAILQHMDEEHAEEARELISYPPDVAGGLMMKEYLSYLRSATVKQVLDDLRERTENYALFNVQYIYIVTPANRLAGVLRLRDTVLHPPETKISRIMIDAVSVPVDASLDELEDFFAAHEFFAAPVVDKRGRLLGVVRRRAVYDALAERSDAEHLRTQGIVGGEEIRSMPVLVRSRRRLSWLSVNILLNMIAASVIALYQDTLAAVIALAVFLPIVSDMSGCSGNQAVAVSMRELALGIVKPLDVVRVWLQELYVGIVNGIALGLLLALAAWAWKGNPFLGLVVGAALACNTVVSVSIGGTVPLVLRKINVDPAVASGPVLTTITDMCGFFLVLSFATLLLPLLVAG